MKKAWAILIVPAAVLLVLRGGEWRRERAAAQASRDDAVEVTRAVRDSTADGHDIKEGDVIAIVDDKITQVGDQFGIGRK